MKWILIEIIYSTQSLHFIRQAVSQANANIAQWGSEDGKIFEGRKRRSIARRLLRERQTDTEHHLPHYSSYRRMHCSGGAELCEREE